MRVKERKIDELEAVDYNPRVALNPNHKEYHEIARSIEAYGVVQPLVLSSLSGKIVGGAQRLQVLRDLGWKKVPTVEVEIESEAQEKALNLALNKITGTWDPDKLADLKREGIFSLPDLPTGFSLAEVEAIGKTATLPPTPKATVPVEPDVKLYQVVVSCNDADHQAEVIQAIEELGYTARGVII